MDKHGQYAKEIAARSYRNMNMKICSNHWVKKLSPSRSYLIYV